MITIKYTPHLAGILFQDSSKSKIKEDSSKRKPSNDRKKQGDIVKSPSPRSLK